MSGKTLKIIIIGGAVFASLALLVELYFNITVYVLQQYGPQPWDMLNKPLFALSKAMTIFSLYFALKKAPLAHLKYLTASIYAILVTIVNAVYLNYTINHPMQIAIVIVPFLVYSVSTFAAFRYADLCKREDATYQSAPQWANILLLIIIAIMTVIFLYGTFNTIIATSQIPIRNS